MDNGAPNREIRTMYGTRTPRRLAYMAGLAGGIVHPALDCGLMAQAAIRVQDLENGRVPEVCAKSGKPAAGTLATKALRDPGTFREILPGGRGATIELPASAQVIRAFNGARARFIGWVVVGIVLLAVATFAGVKILYPVGIGLLVGGYIEVSWARYRNWVGARVDGDEIWVSRAHADFCRSAGRIYGRKP